MGLCALRECKLEDPEASHCRWQDLVSLFLIRELRVVWLSRICLLGRRVFAVNWGRANTPPRAGTGCKFLSPELSGSRPHICGCPTPQHAHSLQDEVLSFSLAPLYSFIHSFTDLSIQSSICSFIHPSTHPPIHPFIHLSIHSSIHLSTHLFPSLTQHWSCGWPFSRQRDTAVAEMNPGPSSWKVQSGRELTQCGECLSTSGILRSQKELHHLRSRAAPWWGLQLGSVGVSHWTEGREGKFQMKGTRKDPQTRTSTQ